MKKDEAKQLVENFENAVRDFHYLQNAMERNPDDEDLQRNHQTAAFAMKAFKMELIFNLMD